MNGRRSRPRLRRNRAAGAPADAAAGRSGRDHLALVADDHGAGDEPQDGDGDGGARPPVPEGRGRHGTGTHGAGDGGGTGDGGGEGGGAGEGDGPVISPGDMLDVYQFQAIRHDFAAGAALRPDQVLMTPYGYPPLPRPPLAAPDGTGKLPPGLAVEFAGHPVFWLDEATKRQPPDESDDAFAIRLFLELVDRGYLNAADGRLRNPLAAEGLDARDPADRARITGYQQGAWDPVLCDLVIGPNPATPPGAIAREATRLHQVHADAYQELVDAYRDTVRTALADARATLRAADFDTDAAAFVAAGEALRRAATAGAVHTGQRAALDRAYRGLLARITHLDDARVVLTIEIERQAHLDAPRGAAAYAEEIRRAHHARSQALERLMSAVYVAPDDANRLRALLVALRDAYQAALGRGTAVLAQAERTIGDQFGDDPTGSVASGDDPGSTEPAGRGPR